MPFLAFLSMLPAEEVFLKPLAKQSNSSEFRNIFRFFHATSRRIQYAVCCFFKKNINSIFHKRSSSQKLLQDCHLDMFKKCRDQGERRWWKRDNISSKTVSWTVVVALCSVVGLIGNVVNNLGLVEWFWGIFVTLRKHQDRRMNWSCTSCNRKKMERL